MYKIIIQNAILMNLENITLNGPNNFLKNSGTLVLLLHGYGSNGSDMYDLSPIITKILGDVSIFSPNGIANCGNMFDRYQWFSLYVDPNIIEKEFIEAAKILSNVIRNIATENNIKNIILIGFSQGAMMAIQMGLSDLGISAVIACSGRMLTKVEDIKKNCAKKFIFLHGKDDDIVSYKDSINAHNKLIENNINSELILVDNLAHSIDMESFIKALNIAKAEIE
jgi:phospholipase/carboxylesterase